MHSKGFCLLLLAALAFQGAAVAHGDIYQYVDARGWST
jgi:hypothetical protein